MKTITFEIAAQQRPDGCWGVHFEESDVERWTTDDFANALACAYHALDSMAAFRLEDFERQTPGAGIRFAKVFSEMRIRGEVERPKINPIMNRG